MPCFWTSPKVHLPGPPRGHPGHLGDRHLGRVSRVLPGGSTGVPPGVGEVWDGDGTPGTIRRDP